MTIDSGIRMMLQKNPGMLHHSRSDLRSHECPLPTLLNDWMRPIADVKEATRKANESLTGSGHDDELA
jgi:hypothetical protein